MAPTNYRNSSVERSTFQSPLTGASVEDPLNELISRVTGISGIFVDRDALRSDYLPRNLPHRWHQIRRLGEILAPILAGSRPSNVLIYGKTGTGKTAVLKHVFERFTQEARHLGRHTYFVYVNCRIAGTEYRTLASLAEAVRVHVPFTGLATAEVFRRFQDGLNRNGGMLIVGLDEIDALVKTAGDNLLYELTRINESLAGSQVSLVGVSNDLMFKDLLGSRVLSSLSEEELVFPPYSAVELGDILRDRAEAAFRKGAVSAGVISLCAALAASEHGDARRALDLLRVAGEVAERKGTSTVEEKHVRLAQGVIERGRVFEALASLPLHSRVVLASILAVSRETGDITSGAVYRTYGKLCAKLGVEALTSRRVSGLISELVTLGVLDGRVVSFGRYGRTKRLSLLIPIEQVVSVLEQDEVLSSMLERAPGSLR